MNTKKIISLFGVLLSFATVYADSNERGIDLYQAELYDAAKIFFLSQANQTPQEQAENQYYLGQSYFELQATDSAAYCYAKAIEINPEYPYGYIGEGRIALSKGDAKEADTKFKKALSLAQKKDASIATAIAEVYIGFNLYPQAEDALAKAEKANKKDSGLFLAKGDLAMKQGKQSQGYQWYEQAKYFNANSKLAYLKLARVYELVNNAAALEYLDQLIAIDPEYIPAYALIGDINRANGKYNAALTAYEKFIAIPGVPLLQHDRYAQLLYFTDQYEASLFKINYVLKFEPNNPVMHRLQAYNHFKLENYELAVSELADFLKNNPEDTHIYLDYFTYGKALIKQKQPEAAIEVLLKAIALDSTSVDVYSELIDAYERTRNYTEAIQLYDKFFELAGENVTSLNFLYYGQTLYYATKNLMDTYDAIAATATPEQQTEYNATFKTYIEKGDKAFNEIIERSPDSYLGYLWRGHISTFVDQKEQEIPTSPLKGFAKPYYEKAIEVMLQNNENGKRNNDLVQAYTYLGYYYLLLDDTIHAGDYYKKILAIDPSNANAKKALDGMKIKY